VLGPSVLGLLWPDLQRTLFPQLPAQKAMVDAVSQFGILLLLLLTGMETDLKLVRTFGRAAVSISIAGVAVPFACGVTLGALMPAALLPAPDKRLITAIFLGTALSISSIKNVAAILHEMNFTRRNLGQIIVASAILEDTVGWVIVAITLSLAQAKSVDVPEIAKVLVGTAAFVATSLTVGRRLVASIIRWTNDYFASEFPVITAILVIMGAMALITQAIGINTVLGAFFAGVLIGESPILTKHIDDQLRGLIVAFFMPVFFGMAGLGADFSILAKPALLGLTLGLIAIASISKFAGAFAGGKIGGLGWRESLALAVAMNARGSTEVIVATIGLSTAALTQDLFTMIVAMAIATTLAMPPMLRWALMRVPLSEEESTRLRREEFEAKGFVSNLERLLLAADASPSGRLASRLAGLIAGPRGIPITILPLGDPAGGEAAPSKGDDSRGEHGAVAATGEAVKQSRIAAARDSDGAIEPAASIDVTVRDIAASSEDAVAEEGRRGYDLLFIGLARTRTEGGFHGDIERVAARFPGPQAIVAACGPHISRPEISRARLLVPVNGTEVSRRAAEVALTIARVLDAPVAALYVTNAASGPGVRRRRAARGREQDVLRDVVALAEQYGRPITTAVWANTAPEDAILAEARRRRSDLIVMGVTRRTGDRLFFGETAAAVLELGALSVLFVTTGSTVGT
jgi:Kef-type K+ transport system membrane component KefB/nucleotide-binding universal stress UspA family protein